MLIFSFEPFSVTSKPRARRPARTPANASSPSTSLPTIASTRAAAAAVAAAAADAAASLRYPRSCDSEVGCGGADLHAASPTNESTSTDSRRCSPAVAVVPMTTEAVQGGRPARVLRRVLGRLLGRLLGCLLGHQHGRVVEIVNSFEVTRVQGAGGGGDDTGIDHEFLRKKQEQCAGPANARPRPRPPAGAAAARRPRRGRSTGARRA